MFVNRKKELKVLEAYAGLIAKGLKVDLALFGLRRIGKTELVLRFTETEKELLVPYLNLQKVVPDVISFSKQFSKCLLCTLAKEKEEDVEMEDLLVLATGLGKLETEYVKTLMRLFKQREIDEAALLDLVFTFPQRLAEKHKIRIVYVLDEFQQILEIHKEVLPIMRAVTEKQSRTNYWVSGSVFSLFDEIFAYKNPFFGQFKRLKLEYFDRESSCELINKFIRLRDTQKRMIYNFAGGQPYYLTAICKRIVQERAAVGKLDDDLVYHCILGEIFDDTGMINEHFEYILDVSLARFSSKDIYKRILFCLSEKAMRLADVSYSLAKPSGEISNYLKALIKTDLIYKEESRYYLRDPLLGFWMNGRYLGKKPENRKILDKRMSDLQENYLRVSAELGKAKEHELRTMLEKKFNIGLSNHIAEDGIEIDLFGKDKKRSYIFEIKWRNKPAGYLDLKKFAWKTEKFRPAKLFFISRSGFTPNALEFSKKKGISLLDRDLETFE